MRERIAIGSVAMLLGIAISGLLGLNVSAQVPARSEELSMTTTPCDEQEPGTIAMIASLAPGRSIADLERSGYHAVPALRGKAVGLVVVLPAAGARQPADVAKDPAVTGAGWLRAQVTTDPSLRSCDHRLADKPAAVALAQRAIAAMEQAGLLTQAEVDADGTTYLLSDDPISPSQLIFTVLLTKPAVGEAPSEFRPVSTLIQKGSGRIVETGEANWYARP